MLHFLIFFGLYFAGRSSLGVGAPAASVAPESSPLRGPQLLASSQRLLELRHEASRRVHGILARASVRHELDKSASDHDAVQKLGPCSILIRPVMRILPPNKCDTEYK